MLFAEYKANFDRKRLALSFAAGVEQKIVGCQTQARPAMPPWVMDWAVLYADGMHFRVKETYKPQPHPNYAHGQRLHFCYQYGATTGTDRKGMPYTVLDSDTIIRLDHDKFGLHMHYRGRNHINQHEMTGQFKFTECEVFSFVEAVETHRQSGASFEDIFFFVLQKGSKR